MILRFLLLLLLVSLLPACTQEAWRKAAAAHQLTLSYDDFGPERIASRLLGPRGASTTVIAHHGATRTAPSGPEGVRHVKIEQAMYFLRRQVKALPATAAYEPLRQRLRATYARLYPLHRRHRDGILASAVALGRGRMNRMLMAPPPMPPSI